MQKEILTCQDFDCHYIPLCPAALMEHAFSVLLQPLVTPLLDNLWYTS